MPCPRSCRRSGDDQPLVQVMTATRLPSEGRLTIWCTDLLDKRPGKGQLMRQ